MLNYRNKNCKAESSIISYNVQSSSVFLKSTKQYMGFEWKTFTNIFLFLAVFVLFTKTHFTTFISLSCPTPQHSKPLVPPSTPDIINISHVSGTTIHITFLFLLEFFSYCISILITGSVFR